MKHEIRQAGPRTDQMAQAIAACVHCGFCLPTCPTYRVLGQEMDSPRGRIVLMKEVLEGRIPAQEVTTSTDQCLGCLACETACPSLVKYGELISPYRAHTESQQRRSWSDRLRRLLLTQTLPYPWRLRAAMRSAKYTKWVSPLIPKALRPMLSLVPTKLPAAVRLEERYTPLTKPRARVALLAGCAQQVLAPEINLATIEVLLANHVEVVVPRNQVCCGALAWHIGDAETAKELGRKNLTAFPTDVDALVTNAAGCGSGLHDYPVIFAGDERLAAAEEFAQRVVDVSKFLVDLGQVVPPPSTRPCRVAYHDACHLAHAQRVTQPPRDLLKSIGNLELVPLEDSDLCCGSAGTYNIDHPEIAASLGDLKTDSIIKADCDFVVMGNIGCMVQIKNKLAERNSEVQVKHTMELLADAYGNKCFSDPGGENQRKLGK